MAPRRALRQQPGAVSTRSGCNTWAWSKLIISSLHTGPSCQLLWSRICLILTTTHIVGFHIGLDLFDGAHWGTWAELYIYQYGDHECNQSIRGFEPINQSIQSIQSKGFKNIQPIKLELLGLIDWLIDSKSWSRCDHLCVWYKFRDTDCWYWI